MIKAWISKHQNGEVWVDAVEYGNGCSPFGEEFTRGPFDDTAEAKVYIQDRRWKYMGAK